MDWIFNKRIKPYFLLMLILCLNLQLFGPLYNFNLYARNHSTTEDAFVNNVIFQDYKPTNITHAMQNQVDTNYSIQNVHTYNFTLNSTHRNCTILGNDTGASSLGYFTVNQSLSSSFLSISLLDSFNHTISNSITYYAINESLSNTFAEIFFPQTGSWNLFVNSSFNFTTNLNTSFTIQLTLFLPSQGFDFTNAISIYNYVTDTTTVNQTSISYHAFFPYEIIFFKITVEPNRRVVFNLKDDSSSNILNSSILYLYQTDPSIFTPALLDTPIQNLNGTYSSSWVSNSLVKSNTLFIKVQLNHPSSNQSSSFQYPPPIIGSFNLSFSFQQAGYSFDRAISLVSNLSLTNSQSFNDQYVHLQTLFFKFEINNINANITIFINSSNPVVLESSQFFIFYDQQGNPTRLYDTIVPTTGTINFSFIPDNNGTYFIEYLPSFYPGNGFWSITVLSISPSLTSSNSSFSYPSNPSNPSVNSVLDNFLFFVLLVITAIPLLVLVVEYNRYSKIKSKTANRSSKSFFSFLKAKFQGSQNKQKRPQLLSDDVFDMLTEIEKENNPDK